MTKEDKINIIIHNLNNDEMLLAFIRDVIKEHIESLSEEQIDELLTRLTY